jgi:3-deoxy-D-manno-octulosonate 8-phosphate phosphatase (KDO 8-P phosphatase)
MTAATDTPLPWQNIQLVGLDVDGVMTRGEIIYTSSGEELKVFNVKDGLGIRAAVTHGLTLAIITARHSAITERRATELGIQHLFQGVKDKLTQFDALRVSLGLTWSQCAYMGDDLPDLPVLKQVGIATCPADAVAVVQQVAHYMSPFGGGNGAVRDLMTQVLAVRGVQI